MIRYFLFVILTFNLSVSGKRYLIDTEVGGEAGNSAANALEKDDAIKTTLRRENETALNNAEGQAVNTFDNGVKDTINRSADYALHMSKTRKAAKRKNKGHEEIYSYHKPARKANKSRKKAHRRAAKKANRALKKAHRRAAKKANRALKKAHRKNGKMTNRAMKKAKRKASKKANRKSVRHGSDYNCQIIGGCDTKPGDILIQYEDSEEKKSNPPKNNGIPNPPSNIGISNPPKNNGIPNPPSNIGISNPPNNNGITTCYVPSRGTYEPCYNPYPQNQNPYSTWPYIYPTTGP